MRIETRAIVLAVRKHGENGAVVRALTPEHGLLAGYVRGGRSRALRPVLIPANVVIADYRARVCEQLAALTVELVHSRAPLLAEPLAAMAIDWTTALTAAALPEAQAYPRIFEALDGALDAVEHAPSARGWAGAIASFEALLLGELGYGVDRAAPGQSDDWPTLLARFRDTGRALDEHLFAGARIDVMAARQRLLARLQSAVA